MLNEKYINFGTTEAAVVNKKIATYWYSVTVRRVMMGGTGGRICLFCDLNCDENLGHLFSSHAQLGMKIDLHFNQI